MKKSLLFLITLIFISNQLLAQDWNYVSDTGTTFILYGMSFPPDQDEIGYACGMKYTFDAEGVITKTTDGGENWVVVHPTIGTIDGLQGIWFIDENIGFAGGWNNYFIKTTDGGTNWTNVTCGTNVWYYVDVEFWDVNNGVAAAVMTNSSQAIFITDDGGDTWVPATSGANVNIMGITYADQNTLFAIGLAGKVYKSTDGGHNWGVTADFGSTFLMGVDFANASFGVVGAEEKMFSTNDGGVTWNTFTTGYENFYATKAYQNGTAYVGGTDENIYVTTDYGDSWSVEYDGAGTSSLYRIRDTKNGDLFACGSQGTILKKINPSSGIFDSESDKKLINIFPNPTNEVLNIKLRVNKNEKYTVEIKNTLGQIIKKITMIGTGVTDIQTINVSDLPKGHYIIGVILKNKNSLHQSIIIVE